LTALESALQSDIEAFIAERQKLYSLKRQGSDVSAELKHISDALRPVRKELRLCRQIETDMPRICEQIHEVMQSEINKTKTTERRNKLWK